MKYVSYLLVLWSLTVTAWATGDHDHFSTAPYRHSDHKWRIGYLQGGDYLHYQTNLIGFVKGLIELGWVKPLTLPTLATPQETQPLWQWLSQHANSDYIEFVADAYWSADWDGDKRQQLKQTVLARLQHHELDLMLALGTWAGQDLANNEHQVPTMVLSIADAVASGVVESATDSGFEHVHARVDSSRYEKQLRLFHRVVKFKTLGVVYEDTVIGRSYAGLSRIEAIAKQLGFTIKGCQGEFHQDNPQQRVIACYQQLAPQVDAFYLTYNVGVKVQALPALIAPILQYKRPSFSQSGQREVEHGVLMSMTDANYEEVGLFHASTMAKIFNGATPRLLNQEFPNPYRLAINLETERRIGFTLPAFILMMVDEVYTDLAVPID